MCVETWEDGANWSKPASGALVGGHINAGMATLGNDTVLYGGRVNLTILDSTWFWNGSAWGYPLALTAAPPYREWPGMVTVGNVIVAFGGVSDLVAPRLDTWLWDGVDWSEITPAASPTRGMPAMAALGGQIVMFNGYSTWLLTLDSSGRGDGGIPDGSTTDAASTDARTDMQVVIDASGADVATDARPDVAEAGTDTRADATSGDAADARADAQVSGDAAGADVPADSRADAQSSADAIVDATVEDRPPGPDGRSLEAGVADAGNDTNAPSDARPSTDAASVDAPADSKNTNAGGSGCGCDAAGGGASGGGLATLLLALAMRRRRRR